jgi:3-hydroxyisobutyrate dehydrogenase-like beta-hydroxyacid dehydrogenase
MKIGFIGIGSMGEGMARNLLNAGHQITIYNRTAERTRELVEEGARLANCPADASSGAEVLITMLADDQAVESVLLEDKHGGLKSLSSQAIHLSMSTLSPAFSRMLNSWHSQNGQRYVSAPVFGRPPAAAAGKLWIVVAGKNPDIECCRPLLEAMGRGISVVGEEPWKANLFKLAGNFLIASLVESCGESFTLLRKAGIDHHQFLEVMNGALFQSPFYDLYGRIIASESFSPAGFKLKLGLKDMRLTLQAAEQLAVPMPLGSLIRDHMIGAMAKGFEEEDWSAFTKVIAENAGL